MSRSRHILTVLILTLVVAASVSGDDQAVAQTPASPGWVETFDQYEVGVPTPLTSSRREDVYVHMRDRGPWTRGPDPMPLLEPGYLSPFGMGHGPHCEPPPAEHPTTPRGTELAWQEPVFICGAASTPHMMTAINGGAYGLLYYTPAAMIDFSGGEATVSFDVSSLRTEDRDWWDVWITPWDDNLAGVVDLSVPDFNGYPKHAFHVRLGQGGAIQQTLYRDFVPEYRGHKGWVLLHEMAPSFTYSATRRDKVVIKLSTTHNSVCFPTWGFCYEDPSYPFMVGGTPTPLTWTKAVVQIGHHSYSPGKSCLNNGACGAGTWHWDNIAINPAVPFTMIRANERAVLEDTAGLGNPMTFTFPDPAPTNAYLRVAAYGAGYQYSTDGGTTWATLRIQPSFYTNINQINYVHMINYWQAIPAGTTSVKLRTTVQGSWSTGIVEYAAIWSEDALAVPPTPTLLPPTPTPFPTETPTNTPTPNFQRPS